MAEKVEKLDLKRDKDFMYYVKDSSVWRVQRKQPGLPKGRPEKVAPGSFKMDTEFIYFVDRDGDVSRAKRAVGGQKRKKTIENPPRLKVVRTKLSKARMAAAKKAAPAKASGRAAGRAAAKVSARSGARSGSRSGSRSAGRMANKLTSKMASKSANKSTAAKKLGKPRGGKTKARK